MFKPVSKEQNRLRLALCGPSGSGKTYTALLFAHALAGPGGRIALIDTEHGSASKYAGTQADGHTWEWDHLSLEHYAPARYIDAIKAASDGGYDVLIIDSLSHAWAGTGGALDQVDHSRDQNKFGAWRSVTPQHNALVEAILACRCHVIATMRSKTEYVLEADDRGKQVPRKIGTKPIQRDGVEYEFDLVADLDHQHTLTVGKTRCPAVDGDIVHRPVGAWIEPVREWLYSGAIPKERPRVEDAEPRQMTPTQSPQPAASGGNGDQPPSKGGAWTEEHKRLADAIMLCANGDQDRARSMCRSYSAFVDKKTGKHVDGVESVRDMRLARVRATWRRVEPEYNVALREAEDAAAQAKAGEPSAQSMSREEEEAAIEATRTDGDGDGLPF